MKPHHVVSLERLSCVPADVTGPPHARPEHPPASRHLGIASGLPAMLKTSRASRSILQHQNAVVAKTLASRDGFCFLAGPAMVPHTVCFAVTPTLSMSTAGASHSQQKHSTMQRNLAGALTPTCPAGLWMNSFATVPQARTGLVSSS